MIDATFYDLWIKNTKSPFSRSSKVKDLDKAIKGFCESIGKSKEAVATKTLLEAWDAWQQSKEFDLGWWNSDRKSKSTNGVVRILSNELLPLFQQHKSSEPRTMIDDPVCYDSPHRRRAENHGAEMAFSLSPLALEVWNISKTSRQRGDTFIGCTDLTTGVCHMLPTYEQMVAEKLGDTALVHNPVFLKSPQRTYADIKDTFGAPPRFGNVGIKFIVGPKQEGIDGYYHNALMRIVGVHGDMLWVGVSKDAMHMEQDCFDLYPARIAANSIYPTQRIMKDATCLQRGRKLSRNVSPERLALNWKTILPRVSQERTWQHASASSAVDLSCVNAFAP